MPQASLLFFLQGIDGDTPNPHYAGWMDLVWFSLGGSGEFGQTRPASVITLTMLVGKLSTTIQLACLNQRRFSQGEIVAIDPVTSSEKLRMELQGVQITGCQFLSYTGDQSLQTFELKCMRMIEMSPCLRTVDSPMPVRLRRPARSAIR
jgi:hypothetical protein